MGKTIKLTEEQIRRFFGEGFGKRLLGESNLQMSPDGEKFASDKYSTKGHSYASGGKTPKDGEYYHTGFHQIPKEGDLPGYGGGVAKMASFGKANLNDNDSLDNNELLKIIKSLHEKNGGGPLNLIDVLEIMHGLKGKQGSTNKISVKTGDLPGSGKEITEDEAFNYLNSINIDFILSNFITVNAPDYVFWRLKNLTTEEINRIKKTYKRDFSNFGQRCDGCGLSEWKTTVAPNEHDDAHVNLEYMGSDASNINGYSLNEEARKLKEYPIPFQIHHMNENPGDNSPLNLSCLCPNCHAITGSYGVPKRDFSPEDFNILASIENGGNSDSLTELMSDEEKNNIVDSLKRGEFDKRSISNNISGIKLSNDLLLTPENVNLDKMKNFGVSDPVKFLEDFNKIFSAIYDEGLEKYAEYHKIPVYPMENGVIKESNEKSNTQKEVNTMLKPDTQKETDASSDDGYKIDGVEYNFKIKITDAGNVYLELYIGDSPFVFDAFRNNSISLTPMYFEDSDSGRKKSAIIDVRNKIFAAILNSFKENKSKMSYWKSPFTKNEYEDIRPGTKNGRNQIKKAFIEPNGEEFQDIQHDRKRRSQATQKNKYSENTIESFIKNIDSPVAEGYMQKYPSLRKLKDLLENGYTLLSALVQSGISPEEETAQKFITKKKL